MKLLKKATNKQAFAKVGIYGQAGSGKTRTAAEIAIGLHKAIGSKKPVAMFDTEPAASYIMPFFEAAGIEFLVADESRALTDLMAFMDEAENNCDIAIIDSITHVWRDAQDSYLAKVNEKRREKRQKPIYALEFHHWKPIKAAWQSFTDRFLSSKFHCVVCGRAGSIYEYQKNEETGKMELITSGTKMATEKELGYEPSLLIEMIAAREEGKIVNKALIMKDRTDTINGHEIDFPNYVSLKPHFDFLNIGGEHFKNMSARNSQDMYELGAEDDGFAFEKRQREIECEELKSLFISYGLDGQSKEAKEKRNELLIRHFNTGSWTAIEGMRSEALKKSRFSLMLELKDEADANG